MKLFELTELQPFDTTNTNMPTFNDMMRLPEYFRDHKDTVWEIEWMSPAEYIDRCDRGFKVLYTTPPATFDLRNQKTKELYTKYAELMKQGTKFPMIVLDYRRNSFSQEGLHRAIAAEMVGVKSVPVLVVKDAK